MTSVEEVKAERQDKIKAVKRCMLRILKDAKTGYPLTTLTDRSRTWWDADVVSEAFLDLLVSHKINLDSSRVVHITITGQHRLDAMMAKREEKDAERDRLRAQKLKPSSAPPPGVTDEYWAGQLRTEIDLHTKAINEITKKKDKAQEELREVNQRLNYARALRLHVRNVEHALTHDKFMEHTTVSVREVLLAAQTYLGELEAKRHG